MIFLKKDLRPSSSMTTHYLLDQYIDHLNHVIQQSIGVLSSRHLRHFALNIIKYSSHYERGISAFVVKKFLYFHYMMWVSHQHNIQLQSKKRSDLNELIQVNAHFRIAVNHYDYRQIVTITDCQIANRSVPHIHYTCQHGIQRENLARNFYAFLKFC